MSFQTSMRKPSSVLALFVMFSALPETKAQEKVTTQTVLQAWKKREQQIRSFEFRWKESRTYAKGSKHLIPAPTRTPSAPRQGVFPPEDVTYEDVPVTLQVENDLVRLTTDWPRWNPVYGLLERRQYISTFDGLDHKLFDGEAPKATPGDCVHKIGSIRKANHNEDVENYELWPILLSYRATNPTLPGVPPRHWQLTTEKAETQGRNCLIVRSSGNRTTETCWVDPERDYSILRYELAASWRKLIDVSYKMDDHWGWVPSEFKITNLSANNNLEECVSGRVTSYQLNQRIGAEAFRLNFPPDTEVQDLKRGESYIVRSDGSKRMILNEERVRGATYHDLLTTETGMAALPPKRKVTWLIYAGSVVMICVLGTCWAVWRRKRKLQTES